MTLIFICAVNVLLFLILLGLVPIFWGLTGAFRNTAQAMNEWSEGAGSALPQLSGSLLTFRQTLVERRGSLTTLQKRLKLVSLLSGSVRWLLNRWA